MLHKFKKPDIKVFQDWVYEAHCASREERAERWRDSEFFDGVQWTAEKWALAEEAGFEPLTINRIFPVINLLKGHQILNRVDISAKARTQDDSTLSELMTEALKFVMDQNEAEYVLSQAFNDQIVPGAGFIFVGHNQDPREEKIKLAPRAWVDMFWDPFGSPWLKTANTRYVFFQPWMDIEILQSLFPNKAKDIKGKFSEFTGSDKWSAEGDDFSTEIEDRHRSLSAAQWTHSTRRRVRPVEMWFTVYEPCLFATFADGRVVEIKDEVDSSELYQVVQTAQQLVNATVTKVRTATFLGDLLLHEGPSPFHHDRFPFVPFVGYTDRFSFPYGVPRQVRGQQEEVNSRRSAALAFLKSRRVLAEKDATNDHEALFEEMNKLNGYGELNSGGLSKVKLDEMGALSAGHLELLRASEGEIQAISGANDERLGYNSGSDSGVALERKIVQSATVTASLFDNFRQAVHTMGKMCVSEIQGEYQSEKILRITDQTTKQDRFVVLNERVKVGEGVEVRNNITQGVYDLVVADVPATDTVREQNLNLLMEAVKKSPPEAVPQLILLWFEMSNVPNKEALMSKLKPIFGETPDQENLSPEDVKQKVMEQIQVQQEKARAEEEYGNAVKAEDLRKRQLENQEIEARIAKIMMDAQLKPGEVATKQQDADTRKVRADNEGFKTGVDIGQKLSRGLSVPQEVRDDKAWGDIYS